MSAAEQHVIEATEIPAEVQQNVATVTERAGREIVVASDADYTFAGKQVLEIAAQAKALEAKRKELIAPALEQQRRINDFFRVPIEACQEARKRIDRAMGAYEAEQRRIREEAERAAREAARKERERMEREAAAAAEKARQAREREEAKARELEAAGRAERAEAMRAQAEAREAQRQADIDAQRAAAAAVPEQPVVHHEAPKAAGISTRTDYDFEIVDSALLPREYLVPDEVAIRRVVRALKDRTNIPGIRLIEKRVSTARTK